MQELLRHGGFLRRLATAIVRDEDVADDVLQDPYVEALRKARRGGPTRAWLTVIAKKYARMTFRSGRRRFRREQAAARLDRVPSTAEALDRLEINARVVLAIKKLDPPRRDAIVLRSYDDLSARGIAGRLSVPVATVSTRMQRARAKLPRRLDDLRGGDRRAWTVVLASPVLMSPRAAATALVSGGG